MMYGRNANKLSLFLPENQSKIQKIQAHANQNQETSFTVAIDTDQQELQMPQNKLPVLSYAIGVWRAELGNPPKCHRAEGQDIHRILWKLTFINLL